MPRFGEISEKLVAVNPGRRQQGPIRTFSELLTRKAEEKVAPRFDFEGVEEDGATSMLRAGARKDGVDLGDNALDPDEEYDPTTDQMLVNHLLQTRPEIVLACVEQYNKSKG